MQGAAITTSSYSLPKEKLNSNHKPSLSLLFASSYSAVYIFTMAELLENEHAICVKIVVEKKHDVSAYAVVHALFVDLVKTSMY